MSCDYCENRKPLYEVGNDEGPNDCCLCLCREATRGPIKLRLFRVRPVYGEQDDYIKISYCPMCGRNLKERTKWYE